MRRRETGLGLGQASDHGHPGGEGQAAKYRHPDLQGGDHPWSTSLPKSRSRITKFPTRLDPSEYATHTPTTGWCLGNGRAGRLRQNSR
jgi:ribosomal protein L15